MHSSPSTQQIRNLLTRSRNRYSQLRTIAESNGNSNATVISRRRPLPNPDNRSSFHDVTSSSVFSTSARYSATHPPRASAVPSSSSMMLMTYPASITATDHYIHLNNANRARAPRAELFAPSPMTAVSSSSSAALPTSCQLQNLFLTSAIPMIGFGFMDNFIMIQAGGLIDSTLGVKFGLATLTAAAMGQVVSDVSGVIFGGTIENAISRTGLVRPSTLTEAQRQLPICKRISMAGAVAGVILGCALGATSLLFLASEDDDADAGAIGAESLDRHANASGLARVHSLLSDMFRSTVDDMGCDECTLYLVDRSSSPVLAKGVLGDEDAFPSLSSSSNSFRIRPLDSSCRVGSAPRQCLVENDVVFENAMTTVGEENVSKMCMPVYGKDGSVVGVLEFRNNGQKLEEGELGRDNRQMARVMANHVGAVLNHVLG